MSTGDSGTAPRKVTAGEFLAMKQRGERIAVLTCYDHLFARILQGSTVDAVLVGDSVGQVVLGYDSTLPVTMDDMVHHASAVRRGIDGPLLIADMPFLSYQTSDEDAVRNAGRLVQEAGVEAVKVEGAEPRTLERIRLIVSTGVPVMGHLGLTPQSIHRFGGYGVRGREAEEAQAMVEAAARLEEAGCFSLVLEMLPTPLAREITGQVEIPTIGIGAGPACDGQVLVLPDMLGLNEGFEPKFLRRFAELAPAARDGVEAFVAAVRSGEYPSEEESYRA